MELGIGRHIFIFMLQWESAIDPTMFHIVLVDSSRSIESGSRAARITKRFVRNLQEEIKKIEGGGR